MAYVKEYWTDKEKRAEQARKHTKEMESYWKKGIDAAVKNTICYSTDFKCKKEIKDRKMTIIIDDIDSVSAIFKYSTGAINAVLNFSSYKNPGGMFINGSKAQEECLCHESFLYNVLAQKNDFYEWNNNHKNKALYLNRALYSPSIVFIRDVGSEIKYRLCNVITCASPNKSTAQKYQNVSNKENTEVLKSRIKFVLDIAKDNNVETLILGAYGCGVFGQNPYEVANIFKEYLETTHKCFDTVVFAIPDGKDGNLQAFQKIFNS